MKTTKKHYDYFRSRCRYYQKELGLMGWDLSVRREDIGASFANCLLDGDEKWCVIKLAADWDIKDKPLTKLELDISAFHEIIHLRLGALRWLAKSRYTSVDEIDKADEETATAFENFYRNLQ